MTPNPGVLFYRLFYLSLFFATLSTGRMWDIILSLLRADWFLDCADSCVWQDEDGEEDILFQFGKT